MVYARAICDNLNLSFYIIINKIDGILTKP